MADTLQQTATSNGAPEPVRSGRGGTILGPRNVPVEVQNPDVLVAPETDAGTVPSLKWPFALSHNRVLSGGWARETTTRELPISTEIAGVNMRLTPGGIRELHWHKEAEWAYVIAGSCRISILDEEGRLFIDDVSVGDLWYFPAGLPHSIQALGDGVEFLLVFDSGDFSENETFLITDWFTHTPRDVLAKLRSQRIGVREPPGRHRSHAVHVRRRRAPGAQRRRARLPRHPATAVLHVAYARPGADQNPRRADSDHRLA
jgi:oxalate decarboxylase